jgi:hypothetical protein
MTIVDAYPRSPNNLKPVEKKYYIESLDFRVQSPLFELAYIAEEAFRFPEDVKPDDPPKVSIRWLLDKDYRFACR